MNAKRLLKLADFLDKLPRQKFDFAVLTHVEGKPMREALKAGRAKCGTVGCAIGWMPAVFPRHLKWDDFGYMDRPYVVARAHEGTPRSERRLDYRVAEEFLGISETDAESLFTPGTTEIGWSGLPDTATPKQVAKHIRKFVRAEQKREAANV